MRASKFLFPMIVLLSLWMEQAQAEGLKLQGLSLTLPTTQGRSQTTLGLQYQATPEVIGMPFAFRPTTPCAGGVETLIYRHAVHPEKPSRRFLNEHTGGRVDRCLLRSDEHLIQPFVMVGGLTNSQRGSTFVFGPGVKFVSPTIYGFTPSVGVVLAYIDYALRPGEGAIQGFLPTVFLGLKYEATPHFSLGMFKEWLPKGGVTMFGSTVQSATGSHTADALTVSHLTAFPPSAFPNEARSRPSLVAQFTF